MTLKNKKGKERNFRILLKITKKDNDYIIYEDVISEKIYVGNKKEDKLKQLTKDEYEFVSNMVNKMIDKVEEKGYE